MRSHTFFVSTASLITAHLVCDSCRPTEGRNCTTNNHVPFIKSGTWWSADIKPSHENRAHLISCDKKRKSIVCSNASIVFLQWDLLATSTEFSRKRSIWQKWTTCPNTMAQGPQRPVAQCSCIGCIGLRPALRTTITSFAWFTRKNRYDSLNKRRSQPGLSASTQ